MALFYQICDDLVTILIKVYGNVLEKKVLSSRNST